MRQWADPGRRGARARRLARRPRAPPGLIGPLPAFICRTCGVQYAPTDAPPPACPICQDERQYVGWNGQQWTTLDALHAEGRRNTLTPIEPGIVQIATVPPIAIGQCALLVVTPAGHR